MLFTEDEKKGREKSESAKRPESHPRKEPERPHILVVDDDPDILAALLETLETEGYSVEGARDGYEALEAMACHRPDLIVTDLMMPTMTGMELIGAMRSHPTLSGIPTLIITAVRGQDAQKAAGVAGIFPKPLDLDGLLRAISVHTAPRPEEDDPSTRN